MNFNDILNKTTADNSTPSTSSTPRPLAFQPPQNLASTSNSATADYSNIPIPGLASPSRTPVPRSSVAQESDPSSRREPWSNSTTGPAPPPSTATGNDTNQSDYSTQPSRKRKATLSADANELTESHGSMDKNDDGVDEDGQDGEEKPKRKRRRQALSCMPCKKRKIRCDRKHPCTPCIKRNDQDQCRWSIIDAGNSRDKDVLGESVIPITSPFPPNLQSPPPAQEERYVLRFEYEELKATVGRLESIVAALTGSIGVTPAPAQASNAHPIFSGHPTTPKGALTSPAVTSAAPHALYTPINSMYTTPGMFAPPVSSMRPGSSSPPSAGETNGILKYLNLPHSGSGNSPTSTPSMSSSTSACPDRIDGRGNAGLAPTPTLAHQKSVVSTQPRDAHVGVTTPRYATSPNWSPPSESNNPQSTSRGKEPRPTTARSSSSTSTLSAAPSREMRSQSPVERFTKPTRPQSLLHSSMPSINTQANRKDPHHSPPASRPSTTLTRIAPNPRPPAPGILGRVDTSRLDEANRRELDTTAAAPISSLISAHWNQRQRADNLLSIKARKRPIQSHGTSHLPTRFITSDSNHQRDESSSDEDNQGDHDEEHQESEGSVHSSIDQQQSSTSAHSTPRTQDRHGVDG